MALEVGTINRDTTYPFNDTGTGMAFAIYQTLKATKVNMTKRDVLPPAAGVVTVKGGRVLVGVDTTFTATFLPADPTANKVSIGQETRTVLEVRSATEVLVDDFFTVMPYTGVYSAYNSYDNKPSYYTGTLAAWNALSPIEQWRVNVDLGLNSQLNDLATTAFGIAAGLVPYFSTNAEVDVLVPSTLAGLQKLPALILPGELTAASGTNITLNGGVR